MGKSENMTEIQIDTEYITLGQFLKAADVIQTGGMAKWFLSEYEVFINGEQDQRRGRKLRTGDKIEIPDVGEFTIV
ncbi:S4 domain-containing protein YaaA [Cytobacillus firmus]|uniref:S4 domain-containing protein YaaA n=1 Tax=Cytobacillus firmus TaxID=1399 RepID=UPI000A465D9C|nr:S4 domain-containing protein YaaA [Cytobacillus firmus]